jgi:flagellin-like hook-associated protein FlgL
MLWRDLIVSVCLCSLGGVSIARAADAPAEKADATKSQPSPAEISQWIKDLDSDTFATRQTAADMLVQTGKPAVEPVAEASVGKSLEVTMQAIGVLRRLMQSTDAATCDAAKAALEQLAKSESAAAVPAKEALKPPPAASNPPGNFGLGNINGNVRIFGGGNIQIGPGGNIQVLPGGNIPAGGVQVFRIQANNVNQTRSVDVNENGKRTHITDDQNGIEVKVTESVGGKEKTDTFKAKDADELKKKFPEAHKLYEKYMAGGGIGNLPIQAQAMPIQIGVLQPGALPGIAPPPAPNAEARKQIAEAQKRLAEATANLRKNAGAPGGDDFKRALDQLEEARKALEEARGKLGGQ